MDPLSADEIAAIRDGILDDVGNALLNPFIVMKIRATARHMQEAHGYSHDDAVKYLKDVVVSVLRGLADTMDAAPVVTSGNAAEEAEASERINAHLDALFSDKLGRA